MEIANVEQARAWDGEEGAHWASHADRYEASLREYNAHLQAGARIVPSELVLDIGCGNGTTTLDAARAASDGGSVGIDLSASMLAKARAAANDASLTNVDFVHGDAQVYGFEDGTFDVAISRFGVMFFSDPVAAFSNIARSLTADGRLALIAWKPLADNEWFSEIGRALALERTQPEMAVGAPSPFGLSEPSFVRGVLNAAGFADVTFDTVDATYNAGANPAEAFEYLSDLGFTRRMLQDVDEHDRKRALDALRATIDAHQTGRGVTFDSASWLISASRHPA
jgi:ubiquinone/menaquinone biosynthesis C-methylase UbiE